MWSSKSGHGPCPSRCVRATGGTAHCLRSFTRWVHGQEHRQGSAHLRADAEGIPQRTGRSQIIGVSAHRPLALLPLRRGRGLVSQGLVRQRSGARTPRGQPSGVRRSLHRHRHPGSARSGLRADGRAPRCCPAPAQGSRPGAGRFRAGSHRVLSPPVSHPLDPTAGGLLRQRTCGRRRRGGNCCYLRNSAGGRDSRNVDRGAGNPVCATGVQGHLAPVIRHGLPAAAFACRLSCAARPFGAGSTCQRRRIHQWRHLRPHDHGDGGSDHLDSRRHRAHRDRAARRTHRHLHRPCHRHPGAACPASITRRQHEGDQPDHRGWRAGVLHPQSD